jgi:tetratricopeptide (TPR) repeat protein
MANSIGPRDLSGDWEAAKQYFLKTIENARANQFIDWEVRGCICLAEAAWKRGELALAEQYYQITSLAAKKEESSTLEDITSYGLGKVSLIQDDTEAAKSYFRQSLEVSIKNGNTYQVKFSLEAIIFLNSALRDKAASTAKMIGASKRFLEYHSSWGDRNYYLSPFELEGPIAQVRHWLGEVEYHRLVSEGQGMTMEEVVEFID